MTTRPPIAEHQRGLDTSGFRFFSEGAPGEAHALAHRLLDEGRERDGLRLLGDWLSRHDGEGSQWVHLHWHMAVFEIAAGRLQDAHRRFQERILPAVATGEALTDGPSLLWRLWLAGGDELELEWGPVRDAAVRHLGQSGDPYVELHNVLALAGARDVVAIDRWLDSRYALADSERERFLLQMAWALRTFANRDWVPCLTLLASVEKISQLGGSRAQNELFGDLRRSAARRARRPAA